MNLFEDIKFQDIILIIFFIIIIYLIYKVNINNNENFDVTTSSEQPYIDAIGNIGNIVDTIYKNNGNFTIPLTTTTINNLIVDGNVRFTNKNTNILEIFPKYMVIPWASSTTDYPTGWALCDGSNGTPDLRGRFIYGSYPSTSSLYGSDPSTTSLPGSGGEENVQLTTEMMPNHSHDLLNNIYPSSWTFIPGYGNCFASGFGYDAYEPGSGLQLYAEINTATCITWSNVCGINMSCPSNFIESPVTYLNENSSYFPSQTSPSNPSHNNMPPYYVLIYIMKTT